MRRKTTPSRTASKSAGRTLPLCALACTFGSHPVSNVCRRTPAQMAAKAEDDSDLYMDIPLPLRLKMMPFQREGVRFALAHGGRALIGDEMGAWHLASPNDMSPYKLAGRHPHKPLSD